MEKKTTAPLACANLRGSANALSTSGLFLGNSGFWSSSDESESSSKESEIDGESLLELTPEQKELLNDAILSRSLFGVKAILEKIRRENIENPSPLNLNFPCNCYNSRTPLQAAIAMGEFEIVKHLLESGADPNYHVVDESPLHMTFRFYNFSTGIAQVLLEHGADLSNQNSRGETALMLAVRLADFNFISNLWSQKGAKESFTLLDEENLNVFHHLAESFEPDNEKVVSLLCEHPNAKAVLNYGCVFDRHGAEIFAEFDPDTTELPLLSPLEKAIRLNRSALVIEMLRHGAHPFSRNLVAVVGSADDRDSKSILAERLLEECRQLYFQSREEIITFGLHVFNPRLAEEHGPLRDVFRHILPHLCPALAGLKSHCRMNTTEDLAHVCFKDVNWLQMFPLTEISVMDYFSLSQFYDRTCINEQLRMQTRFTTAGASSQATTGLEDMVGIEYVLRSSITPPRLFIIHKRQRHSPTDVETLASYYILDGTIYQAPNLLTLLKCRLTTSLSYLNDALRMGSENLRYDPNLKTYVILDQPSVPLPIDGDQGRLQVENRTLDSFFALTSQQ